MFCVVGHVVIGFECIIVLLGPNCDAASDISGRDAAETARFHRLYPGGFHSAAICTQLSTFETLNITYLNFQLF